MSRERQQRIVIAEDDEGIRELLTIRLELAGYHTLPARNGVEALEIIQNMDPHGLVLDIGMPILDGFGVLEALRMRPKKLAILVLTARHAKEDVRRAIGLGASDYVAKPFDDAELLKRVARMLKVKSEVYEIE
jgi:DNA-binding response OmpR family regulator